MKPIREIQTQGSGNNGAISLWKRALKKSGRVFATALTVKIFQNHSYDRTEARKYELCEVSVAEMKSKDSMTVGDFIENINKKDIWKITDLEASLFYFLEIVKDDEVALMPIDIDVSSASGERRLILAIINKREFELVYLLDGLILSPDISFIVSKPNLLEVDPEQLARNNERIARDVRKRNMELKNKPDQVSS